jgi:YVTN family beta-propeller protein
MLIVGNEDYVDFLDTERLKSGNGDPKLGRIYGGNDSYEAYVSVTADDRILFVSDHHQERVSVYNLEKARKAGFNGDFKIGTISGGRNPLAILFSPDQRYAYLVSETAARDSTWAAACPQNPKTNKVPINGIINVVDVERAKTDPANSILSRVKAGCVAVRMALSPKGDRAYVTARTDNTLVVLDTTKFLTDPENARIATVPVGNTPTGVALMDGGAKLVVTNVGTAQEKQSLTVIDAAKVSSGAAAVLGTIPVGTRPRDASLTPDGRTLYVPNFDSSTLQLVDLDRLRLHPVK